MCGEIWQQLWGSSWTSFGTGGAWTPSLGDQMCPQQMLLTPGVLGIMAPGVPQNPELLACPKRAVLQGHPHTGHRLGLFREFRQLRVFLGIGSALDHSYI